MKNAKLKKQMLAFEAEDADLADDYADDEVEILADSLQQALEIASRELNASLDALDYQILEKGSKGMFGMGRTPYRVLVKVLEEDHSKYSDIDGMDVSLSEGKHTVVGADGEIIESRDGRALVRIYRHGVHVRITPARGAGEPVDLETVLEKIKRAGVLKYDRKKVEKAVNEASDEPVKIAEFVPKPEADSTLVVEVAPDKMKATITVSPPRPGGRHLLPSEVINALKGSGVVYGFKEEEIENVLDNEIYSTPMTAAEGDQPKDGDDAYIDYKVRIDKTVEFKEDESGRIDFLSKDLVENVVQGQVLAELVPAQKGRPGRTVTNQILPAEDGKSTEMIPGKGTILSDDGRKIIAERNGQVVYRAGRLNVEEVYTISGDVGLDTGNIMFLGSVVVRGSVTDNMQVKAAGNIEVGGSVQKSQLEAEGDIVVRQGIQGRDGALIESTTGSLYAKFIQNTKVSVEKDLIAQEGILHSYIDAGGKIHLGGKRAQIVGGEIMAGEEIRVKQLGAQASTPTRVVVGTNPKILRQIKQLDKVKENAQEKLDKVEQNIRTLNMQKSNHADTFTEEKEEMLVKMMSFQDKLKERLEEAKGEQEQLQEYLEMLSSEGAIHVEKTLYPGVTVEINGAIFEAKDEYTHVTLVEENGNIKIMPYQDSEENKKDWRKRRMRNIKKQSVDKDKQKEGN